MGDYTWYSKYYCFISNPSINIDGENHALSLMLWGVFSNCLYH